MSKQHIEVTNRFTNAKTYYEVDANNAFKALCHFRNCWATNSAKIVVSKSHIPSKTLTWK